jgi:hypothetical protein
MTQKDITNLVEKDGWMMDILYFAEKLNLPDWAIGAGFIRNKVWDHLHWYIKTKVDTNDIDLVYYNGKEDNEEFDKTLSEKLQKETGINWEIVNEAFAHKWNNALPSESTFDAISKWPETATCIGLKLEKGELKMIAPYGIDDLINLIIRPSPKFSLGKVRVKQRVEEKKWLEKWPKLKFDLQA